MPRLPYLALSLALLVAMPACSLPDTATLAAAGSNVSALGPRVIAVQIAGAVKLPAALLSNNGAGIVSNNGSSVIGKTKNYRLAALDEVAGANIEVYLADIDGTPIPGLPSAQTDAEGHYSFPRVPQGFTFLVVAKLPTASGTVQLHTLASSDGESDAADVSAASTFAAAAVLDGKRSLGEFDAAGFASLTATAAAALTDADLADLNDPAAMIARIHALEAENAKLQAQVATLQQKIATLQPNQGNLQNQIQTLNSQSPAPGTSPAPAASGTSAPAAASTSAPTPAASASPTAAGTSAPASAAPSAAPTAAPTATPGATSSTPAPTAPSYAHAVLVAGDGNGYQDGPATSAKFGQLAGMAFDAAGNLFVADESNNCIREITPGGVVSTFAGQKTAGYRDAVGKNAQFSAPWGLAFNQAGYLLVADGGNDCIRQIAPDGTVTTLAGSGGNGGYVDGSAASARFNEPHGLAVDATGNVYVGDDYNHRLRRIGVGGSVTTIAGSNGFADGQGAAAQFHQLDGLSLGPDGAVYVADAGSNAIRRATPQGAVTTLAGAGASNAGLVNGSGSQAHFNYPTGVAVDAHGDVFVADMQNDAVRMITPAGLVSTIAGNGTAGGGTGALAGALFSQPRGVALDAAGNLYVSDRYNYRIVKLTP